MLISDWSSDVGSSDLFAALLDSGAYMKYHAVGVILLGIIASIFGRSFASEPPAGTLAREEGFVDIVLPIASQRVSSDNRSEERRVGKECVRTCRSRWSPYN